MGVFFRKSKIYTEEKQLAEQLKSKSGISTWLYHLVLIPTISIRNTSYSFEIRIDWLWFGLYFIINKEIWCTQIDERTEEEKKATYGSYNYRPPKIKEVFKKKYHFFKEGPF